MFYLICNAYVRIKNDDGDDDDSKNVVSTYVVEYFGEHFSVDGRHVFRLVWDQSRRHEINEGQLLGG